MAQSFPCSAKLCVSAVKNTFKRKTFNPSLTFLALPYCRRSCPWDEKGLRSFFSHSQRLINGDRDLFNACRATWICQRSAGKLSFIVDNGNQQNAHSHSYKTFECRHQQVIYWY